MNGINHHISQFNFFIIHHSSFIISQNEQINR